MTHQPCPCGGSTLGSCCGPILAGALATGPEQVMRSRFTAFTLGDAAHLLATWHPGTAPSGLTLDNDLTWRSLDILSAPEVPAGARRGLVEFRAHFLAADGRPDVLHERSRFVHQGGRWWYLDGRG